MQVPSFYSPLRGIGLDDVWHDHDRCPIGQSIAPADRVAGTGSLPRRCPYCALLDCWPAPALSGPPKLRPR